MRMILKIVSVTALLAVSTSAFSWWNGNNGYYNNWPEWTPMYWMDEFFTDGYNGGGPWANGPWNTGPYGGYGYGPRPMPYGYAPPPYVVAPMAPPAHMRMPAPQEAPSSN